MASGFSFSFSFFSSGYWGHRALLLGCLGGLSCAHDRSLQTPADKHDNPTFGKVVEVLKKHTDVVVLGDPGGPMQVAVVPQYQGRVMTSTVEGMEGQSLGWVNTKLIASGKTLAGFNPVGGEDRFWLGPEGSAHSLYFDPEKSLQLPHWRVPAPLDREPWDVRESSADAVTVEKRFSIGTHSGTTYDVAVERTIRLLNKQDVENQIGVPVDPGVHMVAFESDNKITNAGTEAWAPQSGMPGIWILGMYPASDKSTVVVPIVAGDDADLGEAVNDRYFTDGLPPQRLAVQESAVFFRGDGKLRSKIGISPRRARDFVASYDAEQGVLTLIKFSFSRDTQSYANGTWDLNADPYAGDVINSYNDGPSDAGDVLGRFFELESSGPALPLAPGQSARHQHRTIHLKGPAALLDAIARPVLGVGLDDIKNALPWCAGTSES